MFGLYVLILVARAVAAWVLLTVLGYGAAAMAGQARPQIAIDALLGGSDAFLAMLPREPMLLAVASIAAILVIGWQALLLAMLAAANENGAH